MQNDEQTIGNETNLKIFRQNEIRADDNTNKRTMIKQHYKQNELVANKRSAVSHTIWKVCCFYLMYLLL